VADDLRVAAPPSKPLLVFDGDCGFCRRWISRWQRTTADAVDYLPFQEESIARRFPEIPPDDFHQAVQLISPDGSVCSGAEAVFRSLAAAGKERWLLWCYRRIPSFPIITEVIYDEVATHREFLSKLDRFFLGSNTTPRQYALVQFVFLRGLALVYLIAFASLWMQIQGLIGSQGIVPAQSVMTTLKEVVASQHIGATRFRIIPTLAWWADSDRALNWQCGAGVGLSLLLLFGIAPAPALFLLWALYLSLSSIASPFLNFQWDALLLETGLIAIFFAPLTWLERLRHRSEPPRPALWLLRWLLFRLMFESGWVKLASGDPMWRHLTALRVHFETQPLPTWIGWYAHQLPATVLTLLTFLLFVIELAVPFLIFCGRKPRLVAASLFVLLQIIILLTGNYTFFNWLTILLCLPLLDDAALQKWIPRRFHHFELVPNGALHSFSDGGPFPISNDANQLDSVTAPLSDSLAPRNGERGFHLLTRWASPRWPWKITFPVAVLIFLLTALTFPAPKWIAESWPRSLVQLHNWLNPFRSFNTYGLFANMTPTRPEIILEGSNDGQKWEPYEFKDKPGDLKRAPAFVAPFQPRLDWQMWFAALERVEQNPWLVRLEYQLLKNSPPVVALLAQNPFPQQPPKFIRAQLYQYHFTDFATRRATGQWWRRNYLGDYIPALSLQDFEPHPPK
jgi:lipase maturation factor 1